VYDHYNTGEFEIANNTGTKYGTRQELKDAITSLKNHHISVYADVVLNHQTGGQPDGFWEAIRVEMEARTTERWGDGWERGKIEIRGYTRFDYPERAGAYSSFKWSARHFDSVDTAIEIRQEGQIFHDGNKYIYRFLFNEEGYDPHLKNFDRWVSLEKGNYDFLTSCDIDYGRPDVREEMKNWGEWFVNEFGFDGVRLDAVKHISANYTREWIGHVRYKAGRDLFAVAEYINGDVQYLQYFIDDVSFSGDFPQRICLFDFPLFFKLRQASYDGEDYSLQNLNTGTLLSVHPDLAVTFIDNHDYEFGRDYNSHVQPWFKPLGYSFILLRKHGFPCLFSPDYYGSSDAGLHNGYQSGREYLELLLKLRKQFALGEERYYDQKNIAGWVRMGFTDGAKGAMAVVVNTAYNKVLPIAMNTGRIYRSFYHFATIKWTPDGFVVVRGAYELYGNKEEGLWTDEAGWADFVADGGSVSVWLEEGTHLEE
jgi:alpha-amylase